MTRFIFIVFQSCICGQTMKYSPRETASSPLFWKGRLGQRQRDQRWERAALPHPQSRGRQKDRGGLSLHSSRGRKRKRSRRVPPAGQTIKPIASGKGNVSICDSVCACPCEAEADQQHRSGCFAVRAHQQAELHAKGISLLQCFLLQLFSLEVK